MLLGEVHSKFNTVMPYYFTTKGELVSEKEEEGVKVCF